MFALGKEKPRDIRNKLHLILQYYQSHLMRFVLSVVQSCSGDVQHKSSQIKFAGN